MVSDQNDAGTLRGSQKSPKPFVVQCEVFEALYADGLFDRFAVRVHQEPDPEGEIKPELTHHQTADLYRVAGHWHVLLPKLQLHSIPFHRAVL